MGFLAKLLGQGERFNLSKDYPNVDKIGIGLGWNVHNIMGGEFDLDASVFMLDSNKKTPDDRFFVFYNNQNSSDGSVFHTGDEKIGGHTGDDETIFVTLSKVDYKIFELVFVVTIHEAIQRRQNFGQVRSAFIRLYDVDTNRELLRYDLNDDFEKETAIEFGKLYKKDNDWRFQAVGTGYNKGLQGFVDKYT